MAQSFRFVHLSDIHFGQEGTGPFGPHDDVRRELLRDCRVMRESLGAADGILVSGDQAYAGKREEYVRAAAWIDSLAEVVGCDPELAIRVIPGNHDVDRDKINWFGTTAHERLRNTPSTKLEQELRQLALAAEDANPLLPKLSEYRQFASRYGCDFEPPERLSWRKIYELDAHHRFAILGLTSVLVCDHNDGKDKMILGSNQYIFEREDDVEIIVMVHHPLAWFKDQQDAQPYIDRARLILTGHEHLLRVSKEITDAGDEFLHVSAGATNPPETTLPYPYRYNWMELSLKVIDEKTQVLQVSVHPRVWEQSRTMFVPDQNRLNGRHSVSFDLTCPHYKRPLAAAHVEAGSGSAAPVGEVGAMPDDHTALDYQRLQHFFWSYIGDWKDRIQLLVSLDLLPDTQSQPIPHTLERMALERARDGGKMHALWDEVMKHVPIMKRKPNPFPVPQAGK